MPRRNEGEKNVQIATTRSMIILKNLDDLLLTSTTRTKEQQYCIFTETVNLCENADIFVR